MKRMVVVLASGLLLLVGSATRAEEGGDPATLPSSPLPAKAAPSCCATAPCCAAPACAAGCGGHFSHFCDWLCYKPAKSHCACACHISPCWPPLYTWFLDMCPAGGGGGGACGHAAACAGGGCARPTCEAGCPR
jgi:hypothetical protein